MIETLHVDLPMKRKIGSMALSVNEMVRLVAVRVILKRVVRVVVKRHAPTALPVAIGRLADAMKYVLEAIVVSGMVVVVAIGDQGVRRTMNGMAMTARELRIALGDLITI